MKDITLDEYNPHEFIKEFTKKLQHKYKEVAVFTHEYLEEMEGRNAESQYMTVLRFITSNLYALMGTAKADVLECLEEALMYMVLVVKEITEENDDLREKCGMPPVSN